MSPVPFASKRGGHVPPSSYESAANARQSLAAVVLVSSADESSQPSWLLEHCDIIVILTYL